MTSIKNMPKEEFVLPGNAACPGCPATIAARTVLKALGKRTIMVIPACCSSIWQSSYPNSSITIPVFNTAFETTAAVCSGIVAGLKKLNISDVNVLGWAGDGGTYDIGIQALSGAAERKTDFLYVCYNNEMYSNTGIQRSGATPKFAWTTTTWLGKKEEPKDFLSIMAAHKLEYIASASIAYPSDLYDKVQRAMGYKGTKYIEIHSPCPAGWKFDFSKTIEIARLAVQTRAWSLYEIIHGKYKVRRVPKPKPVGEYLKPQGRFRGLKDEDIEEMQAIINKNYEELISKER